MGGWAVVPVEAAGGSPAEELLSPESVRGLFPLDPEVLSTEPGLLPPELEVGLAMGRCAFEPGLR